MRTKLLIILFFTLFFFKYSAFSEWEKINIGIDGASPRLRYVKLIDTTIYIGAVHHLNIGQGLYSTSNFGESWKLLGLENYIITSITKIKGCLFVGTERDGIFYSSDEGSSWEQRNNGITKVDEIIKVKSLLNFGDTLLAATEDLYFSTNFGETWNIKKIDEGFSPFALFFNKNVLIVGGYKSNKRIFVYRSTDSGNNWSSINLPLNNDYQICEMIELKNRFFFTNNTDTLYFSDDLGINWKPKYIKSKTIVSINSWRDTLFAVTHNGMVYFSFDNGNAFYKRNENEINDLYITQAIIQNKIFGCWNYPTFYILKDMDNVWQQSKIGIKLLPEVNYINRCQGKLLISTIPFELLTSSNKGDNWDKLTTFRAYFPFSLSSIIVINDSKLILYDNGLFATSYDVGKTWKLNYCNFPEREQIYGLHLYENIWLAIYNDVHDESYVYSLDEGRNWLKLENTKVSDYNNKSFLFKNNIFTFSGDVGLYKTGDLGKTWISLNNEIGYNGNNTYFTHFTYSDSVLYCIEYYVDNLTTQKRLVYSEDMGFSFKKKNIEPFSKYIFDKYFDNYIYVLKAIQNKLFIAPQCGGFYYTSDKGESWIDISKGIEYNLVYDCINLGEYLYIATTNGLYRDKLSEFGLGTNEETQLRDIRLSPNPASNYIELVPPLENRELGGVLEPIQIFDIYGNRVLPVETQNFVSLQRIDISSLSAGVYFVRIDNEKPMKFVKL